MSSGNQSLGVYRELKYIALSHQLHVCLCVSATMLLPALNPFITNSYNDMLAVLNVVYHCTSVNANIMAVHPVQSSYSILAWDGLWQ